MQETVPEMSKAADKTEADKNKPDGQKPDGYKAGDYVAGQAGIPGQGPHMLIILQVKADQIVKAQFSTYGCPAAVACGQYVTEQVEGKNWHEVEQQSMDEETIIAGIGRMPLGREHCPGLAIGALRHALEQLRS